MHVVFDQTHPFPFLQSLTLTRAIPVSCALLLKPRIHVVLPVHSCPWAWGVSQDPHPWRQLAPPSHLQLPVAPQLGWELWTPTHISAGICVPWLLSGLVHAVIALVVPVPTLSGTSLFSPVQASNPKLCACSGVYQLIHAFFPKISRFCLEMAPYHGA